MLNIESILIVIYILFFSILILCIYYYLYFSKKIKLQNEKNQILVNDQIKSNNEFKKMNDFKEFVLAGAGLGTWDWNFTSNVVEYDKRWCEILGYTNEEVPNLLTSFDLFVHPADKDRVYSSVGAYVEGKSRKYEEIFRMRHKNGHWIWILARAQFSEYDESKKPIRLTGIHLDISKYQEAHILNSSIQRMGKIGGWELEVETSQMMWTEQVYLIHGLNNGQVSQLKQALEIYKEKEKLDLIKCINNCINEQPFRQVFEYLDSSQKSKWIEISGEPVFGVKSKVVKIIGTYQDITEKIEAEKILQLERMKSIHSAKLASLGEMSAGIAHEINNPLAILDATIGMLDKVKNDSVKFENKIEVLSKAVLRITKIVNGLKKFSRTSDYIEFRPSTLSNIVIEALVFTEARAKRYSTEISLNFDSQSKVLCDPLEIEQVMINLINNALDAIKENQERWIKINIFDKNEFSYFQIIDSGKGISVEIENKLFQPFFTTKSVGEGTGLGLSISKGILDHHQASFRINRDYSNTCFEIQFKKIIQVIPGF